MFSVVTICIITGHLLLGVVCWTLSEDVACRSLDLTVGLDVLNDGSSNKENPRKRPGLHSILDSPVTKWRPTDGIRLIRRLNEDNTDTVRDDSTQLRSCEGSSPLAFRDGYNECLVTLVSSDILCQTMCEQRQCKEQSNSGGQKQCRVCVSIIYNEFQEVQSLTHCF